jgi:phage terminase large subunit-like protein
MHKLKDHDPAYVISHVMYGRWRAFDREKRIKALAEADSKEFKNYQIVVEREPGSGGKESAENTIRNLAGYRVSEDRVTGSKDMRRSVRRAGAGRQCRHQSRRARDAFFG